MTKLSEDILDEIDGGEERRGRDGQLTEWVERARKLERDAERYATARELNDTRPLYLHGLSPEAFDAAIDAARR